MHSPKPPEPLPGQGASLRSRWERMRGVTLCAASLAAGAVALRARDPHADGSWGKCPSLWLFGVACPLCGGLRAVNDLAHGHLLEAFWSNALFVSLLPVLAVWWLWIAWARWRGDDVDWRRPLEWRWVAPGILVVLAVFAMFRNTPWGARFYP